MDFTVFNPYGLFKLERPKIIFEIDNNSKSIILKKKYQIKI
jgi:hypothetical protein